MKKIQKIGSNLTFPIAIFLATIVISYLFGFWFGYPRGHDAAYHLFKLKFIDQNFPQHHWWYTWAAGMPLLLYYPPLPYYLLVFLKRLSGASFEFLLATSSVFSVGLTSYALFLLVYHLTKKRLFACLAALLYLTCPSSWAMTISTTAAGVYMRALAMPFFLFGFYFSICFWQEFEAGTIDQKLLKLAALFWGLTLLIHQYIALLGYATFTFFTFFMVKGKFFAKLSSFLKIVLIALLLSASFSLPLLRFFPKSPTTTWVSPFAQQPVSLKDLFPLPDLKTGLISPTQTYNNFTRLTPFLLPLGLILTFLFFLFRLKNQLKKKQDFLIRLLEFFVWLSLFWASYSTGGLMRFSKILPPIQTAYSFLGTRGATYFLPIFLSIVVSLLLFFLLEKRGLVSWLVAVFLIISLGLFLKEQNQGIILYLEEENWPTQPQALDFSPIPSSLVEKTACFEEKNCRLGLGSTASKTALDFSNQLPNFPQTGHYFAPGVPNFELYYYLEDALWRRGQNRNEISFLLDWWAIEPILAQSNFPVLNQPFLSRLEDEKGLTLTRYQLPLSLLSPSQAPAVLVIGDKKSYQGSFFRSLGVGNLGSRLIIPLLGKSSVEDYAWEDLALFDLVFLYDYQIRNPLPWTAKILADYVKEGGHLIIESKQDLESGQTLPDPFPIKAINPSSRAGNWNFKIEMENPYLSQADLANFSPAQYENEPWGISEGLEVKNWAKTVLSSDGKPVLVEGKIGKGKVLWSGLNLPFHITNSHNPNEAETLKNMILGLSFAPSQDPLNFEIEFKNPQERVVYLKEKARGVLFKENYFLNWHARAKTADGKTTKLKIYAAGPGFMYAPLPQETKEVAFLYRRSWIEKVADLISLITLSWLIFSLIPAKILKRFDLLTGRTSLGH